MYIAATVTFNHNKTTDLIVGGVTSDERKIEVAEDGRLRLFKLNDVIKGVCISDLPILNQGYIFVQDGIQFEVKGHLGGKNYPALVQTDGEFVIATGARIVAKNGITITGGDLRVHGRPENKSAAIDSTLVFAGAHILFSGDSGAMLQVNGNMTWTSGTYIPRLPRDGDPGDRLMTSGLLAIGESAVVAPDLPDPSSTAATNFWIILLTRGTVDTATVGNGYDLWKINFNWLNGVSRTWFFELS